MFVLEPKPDTPDAWDFTVQYSSDQTNYIRVDNGVPFEASPLNKFGFKLRVLSEKYLTEDGIVQITKERVLAMRNALREMVLAEFLSSEILSDFTEEGLLNAFRSAKISKVHGY